MFPAIDQKHPPVVERSFIHQYEGNMRYYPQSTYPKAKLLVDVKGGKRLVVRTETKSILIYDLKLKKEIGKIETVSSQNNASTNLCLVYCKD